ncbi:MULTISPECIES: hypothetical protein [unclassified Brevundimonas]|uniref:hypothetical protein n=1 Tax=unclassified Brevundimonas TaxID=2622653 RepID=UPI0006F58D74|nr:MULTISPECIES: hypothetical protein [unclassified Brevundimonas]KQY82042.1 hypothetical protein ASD25_25360 [Brevundimonas sp. Root1423]KRA19727.1 hypothetical protein ASD59_12070 [Brevundimonas sp. Root608]
MSGMGMAERVRTPWHLWIVGILAALWNGFGCIDYVMTQTRQDEWFAQMGMTEAQIAYFNAMPAWTHGAWAIGVWGGLLGAILLLLRRKWATPVFVISFLGWLAGAVYAFALSGGMEAMGPMWPMQIVIGGACVFFIWYAWMLGKRGVLR